MEFIISVAHRLLISPLLLLASIFGVLITYVRPSTKAHLNSIAEVILGICSRHLPLNVPSSGKISRPAARENH